MKLALIILAEEKTKITKCKINFHLNNKKSPSGYYISPVYEGMFVTTHIKSAYKISINENYTITVSQKHNLADVSKKIHIRIGTRQYSSH